MTHTRFIVFCITFLGTLSFTGGAILAFKGYPGDLMTGGGLAAISGLIGMLSNRSAAVPASVTTTNGGVTKTEITTP